MYPNPIAVSNTFVNPIRLYNATEKTITIVSGNVTVSYVPDWKKENEVLNRWGIRAPLKMKKNDTFTFDEQASKSLCLPVFHFSSAKYEMSSSNLLWFELVRDSYHQGSELKVCLIVDHETLLSAPYDIMANLFCPLLSNTEETEKFYKSSEYDYGSDEVICKGFARAF